MRDENTKEDERLFQMDRRTFVKMSVASAGALSMGKDMFKFIPGAETVRPKVVPSPDRNITTVVEFNAAASEAPESLAVDRHGNIYVSLALTGEIKKVTPEGHVSTFATLPSPSAGLGLTGITFDRRGNLYVAFAGFDSNHGVWRVSKDGRETELFAALTVNGRPDGYPNDLEFDKKGNLYVSDSIGGKVWKIDRKGIVSIWKTDPLLMGVVLPGLGPITFPIGANGLTFDEDEENLYIANSSLGRIVRIPVEDDGNAGDAVTFVENEPLLRGADGITFDEDGKLYVAVMLQDRIVVVSRKGDTAILAEGYPLQNPAGVRFGVRNQENNLYIANFAIFRLLGIVKETPRPALLKILVDNGDVAKHG